MSDTVFTKVDYDLGTLVKDGEIERFYVRTGPSTTELTASQTQDYIKQRFKQ